MGASLAERHQELLTVTALERVQGEINIILKCLLVVIIVRLVHACLC